MSFRQNSRYSNIAISLLAMILAAGIFFMPSYGAELNPYDETVRILERWTASHWGQDCFVWVVRYPEELAGPWAESEALRSGMSEAEQERFRASFVSELKLDTSETFLVSVYSFGARPVNLSPVRDNVSLLASSGERIKPVRYDSSLDSPQAGVVQGLVFFPKQTNKDYVIAIKGMGRTERIFSFAPPEAPPVPAKKPEVVVVNLPKRKPRKKPEPVQEYVPPPPPAIPPRPITPIFREESSDMAGFVRSVRERGGNTSRDTAPRTAPPASQPPRQANTGNAYASRESVLRRFLNFWANNAPGEMYDMLSENSKKMISRENFTKEVMKANDMRAGLKGDYRIDWIGEERAKVIVTHKTLVFRSVSTRTLGVTREGSAWRIVW